jgi:hypothetical protein
MKTYRWSRVIDPLILNLGNRWSWVVKFKPRPLYPRERIMLAIESEVDWSEELF